MQHKLSLYEQKQRVADVPCSLHREPHNLLSKEKQDMAFKMKGQHAPNELVVSDKPGPLSNVTIGVFAFILSMFLFIIFSFAVADGVSIIEFITRSANVGRLLLSGTPLDELRASSRKPLAYKV